MSQTSSSPAGDESSIAFIIASGGIGAICFGLADLLNNHDAAAVIKLGEALKPIAPTWLANPGVAFIVLTLLGCLLCWVHQPKTRLDAFMRGFSVFAVLTVASPYENPALKPVNPPRIRGLISSAVASELPVFYLKPANDQAPPIKKAIITLRNPKTKKIIRKFAVTNTFSLPKRKAYLIEIEAAGFRLTTLEFQPDHRQSYDIYLEPSSIPVEIQYLYGPKKIPLPPP